MIKRYKGTAPQIDPSAYIAESADLIGDVTVSKNASVWYNVTLRGDDGAIVIGEGSNIQDNCVMHAHKDSPAIIGKSVTVGHGAILHGCTVEDGCLIGMGSIVLDGAVIGARSIVGAGALVTSGKTVPPDSLVLGSPAKMVREVTETEQKLGTDAAQEYIHFAQEAKTTL